MKRAVTASVLLGFFTGAAIAGHRVFADDRWTPEAEKFTPPDLEDASLIACGTGGLADGSVKVFVRVDYAHGRSRPFTPMIALRSNAADGLDDCVRWIHDLRKPLEEAQARKEQK